MKSLRLLMILGTIMLTGLFLRANNVQITNVTIVDATHISFDLSWDNSWRVTTPPANYDAVWIFVKRALCPDPLVWIHTNVATGGHIAGEPLTVYQDGYNNAGLFLQRASDGYGNISTVPVTLQLEPITPAGEYEFKVFAIEMVYIPTGAFYIGDGNTNANYYKGTFCKGNTYNTTIVPFQLTNENAVIQVGTDADTKLWTRNGTYPPSGTIPGEFPKGVNSFYCMKYEVTQQQMADFFNFNSQVIFNRWVADPSNNMRNSESSGQVSTVVNPVWGSLAYKYPWRAAIANSANDRGLTENNVKMWFTYLDWVGLRPMTEFEYEKVCRGLSYPVPEEYPWGTAVTYVFCYGTAGQALNPDTPSETHQVAMPNLTAGILNAQIGYGGGRVYRVGFAAKTTTNRISAGAGYYGNLDLSGNATETVISVCTSEGLAFRAIPGDGNISSTGYYNQPYWPPFTLPISDNNVCTFHYRGGSFMRPIYDVNHGGIFDVSYRYHWLDVNNGDIQGIRGVR